MKLLVLVSYQFWDDNDPHLITAYFPITACPKGFYNSLLSLYFNEF